jgi:soluble lytic murein transglycosylase
MKAEAEFHAGWYALEYLHDPVTATGHFANIAAISTLPLSLSRAEYWLGRAAEAAGDAKTATTHYQRAASYPTTFYGQLAVSKLGGKALRLPPPPVPTDTDRRNFEARQLVQVIHRLEAVDYDDRAAIFFRTLADQINAPGEIALLTGLADAEGNHQLALQLAKTAVSRGIPADALAFPTSAIPQTAATPGIDRAVVFAVARQESAFNPGAVSSAGARGLLQLMPTTAKVVAKAVGLPYDKSRLTSDPGYNATLGAAHLGDLVNNFGGSYVMTFAAYNAGASRVNQWVQQYGDPRDPRTDVVNWIESIPFTETRNYVQRLMENLEVYRARFGSPALTIDADLRRGQID